MSTINVHLGSRDCSQVCQQHVAPLTEQCVQPGAISAYTDVTRLLDTTPAPAQSQQTSLDSAVGSPASHADAACCAALHSSNITESAAGSSLTAALATTDQHPPNIESVVNEASSGTGAGQNRQSMVSSACAAVPKQLLPIPHADLVGESHLRLCHTEGGVGPSLLD